MTIHERSFAGGEEHWGNGSLDLERRYRLGSEVNSLSLSRSSSSDKNDPLENFRLTSSIKWDSAMTQTAGPTTLPNVREAFLHLLHRCCIRISRVATIFTIVVLCSVSRRRCYENYGETLHTHQVPDVLSYPFLFICIWVEDLLQNIHLNTQTRLF